MMFPLEINAAHDPLKDLANAIKLVVGAECVAMHKGPDTVIYILSEHEGEEINPENAFILASRVYANFSKTQQNTHFMGDFLTRSQRDAFVMPGVYLTCNGGLTWRTLQEAKEEPGPAPVVHDTPDGEFGGGDLDAPEPPKLESKTKTVEADVDVVEAVRRNHFDVNILGYKNKFVDLPDSEQSAYEMWDCLDKAHGTQDPFAASAPGYFAGATLFTNFMAELMKYEPTREEVSAEETRARERWPQQFAMPVRRWGMDAPVAISVNEWLTAEQGIAADNPNRVNLIHGHFVKADHKQRLSWALEALDKIFDMKMNPKEPTNADPV